MLRYLYSLVAHVLNLGLSIAAFRNKKVQEMLLGRQETIAKLKVALSTEKSTIWIHAASLGEFEQGRPLIEAVRQQYPDWQIVLSFYSPSGYRVRYNYELADAVVYLMGDTPREVRGFLDSCRPDIAVFVKYDFWPVMLHELRDREIPTFLISAIFRKEQLFFKPWGGAYRRLLHCFEHLFVQDQASLMLLKTIGIESVSITGDTRFDRVESVAQSSVSIPLIDRLKEQNRLTLVAGSTWGFDEEMLMQYSEQEREIGIIFAPHELEEERIKVLEHYYGSRIARLSALREGERDIEGVQHLIIDCFGLLSGLYRYADIAYVGGGFGKSIHNTIEAAVYGVPVLFGPKYDKFREAKLLIEQGGGYSIDSSEGFVSLMNTLVRDEALRSRAGQAARAVVKAQLGATDLIMKYLYK